jgi:hypothetical protein
MLIKYCSEMPGYGKHLSIGENIEWNGIQIGD